MPGDWSVKRPQLEPAAGPSSSTTTTTPTSMTPPRWCWRCARRLRIRRASEAAVRRAIAWTFGMQCRDGGFAAFDVDNTSALCGQLPFCDFGEVTDPPSADVVAHVHRDAGRGRARERPAHAARHATGCCARRSPTARGSGAGASTTSTEPVRPCRRWCVAGSRAGASRAIRRAVALARARTRTRTAAGARILRSYEDPAFRGPGRLDPVADGVGAARAARGRRARARRWSAASRGWCDTSARTATGTSREFTGTGFPGDFYIRYHLYRLHFPVMALGRYLRGND